MRDARAGEDPYYSRIASREEISARIDPVVWGDEDGPLQPNEIDQYRQNGFLVLPPLFDATEIAKLSEQADKLAAKASAGRAAEQIEEPDSDKVRSVFRPHKDNPTFAALANDSRLIDRARQILGGDVYLHQFRINYKPAFVGREFSWHSDFETWHVEDGMPRMRAVSVVVMLDPNTTDNGPLFVIPGSHRHYVRCAGETPENHYATSLRKQEYGVPSPAALAELASTNGIATVTGPPGAVLFFDCNMMHASPSNLSHQSRTNAFLVFNSGENQLVEPFGGRQPRPDFLSEQRRG